MELTGELGGGMWQEEEGQGVREEVAPTSQLRESHSQAAAAPVAPSSSSWHHDDDAAPSSTVELTVSRDTAVDEVSSCDTAPG